MNPAKAAVVACAAMGWLALGAFADQTEVRLILPEQLSVRTPLIPIFEIVNHEVIALEIQILDTGGRACWIFHGDRTLTDEAGNDVPSGYYPTENFAGNPFRRMMILQPGDRARLPYYEELRFQLRGPGKYRLTMTVPVRDANGTWHRFVVSQLLTVE